MVFVLNISYRKKNLQLAFENILKMMKSETENTN